MIRQYAAAPVTKTPTIGKSTLHFQQRGFTRMNKMIGYLILMVLFASPIDLFSAESAVFGPKKYLRTSTKTISRYQDSFSSLSAPGRLVIQNGTKSGNYRIKKAAIYINQKQVVGSGNFNPSVFQMEFPVVLDKQNAISVELSDGKKNSYLTVSVIQSYGPPEAAISAEPETIQLGQYTTLRWSSANALCCSIQPGFGQVADSGSVAVSPRVTTTYIITAYQGTSPPATASITVTVIPPPPPLPPTVSISAEPSNIQPNGKSTLSWSSTGARTCVIEPEIGAVSPSGSIQISPLETTAYTITAAGDGGTASGNVTVSVSGLPLPTVTISANPVIINPGASTMIRWESTQADYCEIEPCLGKQKTQGEITVWPNHSVNYSITAHGPGGSATASAAVTVRDYPMPTVNITANPESVQPNGTVTLTWSSTDASSCVIEPDVVGGRSSGSVQVTLAETKTFTITAYGLGWGKSATASVTVNVSGEPLPAVEIMAKPEGISSGGTSTLTWSCAFADSCAISPGIGSVAAIGEIKVNPTSTTVYTITASGPGGTRTKTSTVYVNETPPSTAKLTADPYVIYRGEGTEFKWKTTNSTSCRIRPEIGGYYFWIPCEGNSSYLVKDYPDKTVTYTLTAANSKGSAYDDATITVINRPNVCISANPLKILPGDPATISWYSPDSESCVIDPDIGTVVGSTGSIQVSPQSSTTYTITVLGPLGPVSNNVKVTVLSPPTVSISAKPPAILKGQTSTLVWTSTDVDSCVIEPGIGTVGPARTKSVSPVETTTYTIFAANPLGTATAETTIAVYDPPTVTIGAEPATINQGQTTVLTWTSDHADSCTIDQGIGTVSVSGNQAVSPAQTTTYTITAANPGGKTNATATVTVICPPTISIKAYPDTVQPGETSTLIWSSTDTDSCLIEPGIGTVGPQGSIEVAPSETTQYTITAFGPLGTVSKSNIVAVASSSAKDIFGPKQFVKSGSDHYSETFSAGTGKWKIIVYNGDADGACRISSADIVLNGVQIFGPDFDVKIFQQQKEVVLPSQNTLSVNLARAADGSYLTVQIIQIDPPTVSLTADPITIYKDDAATLSWTSANAYICEIIPSIGRVMPNGEITVSPSRSTTYAITATGVGGKTTTSQMVSVNSRPPTVTLSADPPAIPPGGSTTLTWTSANANTCSMTPSIGSIGTSGSKSVNPTKTTTYKITATGYGGSVSASVVVSVIPLPTVSLSANPETIGPGESSALTWTSTNASSCSIEPGIGAVAASGTVTVTPAETTTYTITASNAAGSETMRAAVTVIASPIRLSITSPLNNADISTPYVMVTGDVEDASPADEVAVVVNGIIAPVYGNQFIANHVPLKDGYNTITAVATDSSGNSKSACAYVNAIIPAKHVWIEAGDDSGVPTFVTDLMIRSSTLLKSQSISCMGPGDVEYLDTRDHEYRIQLSLEGVYYFTVDATDGWNNNYRDTIAITVHNGAQIDTLLKSRWETYSDYLNHGDVPSALALMHSQTRGKYETMLNALLPKLPAILSTKRSFSYVFIHGHHAEYKLSTIENGSMYAYPVDFTKDLNGLWKILDY
jgi:hypothetical protein